MHRARGISNAGAHARSSRAFLGPLMRRARRERRMLTAATGKCSDYERVSWEALARTRHRGLSRAKLQRLQGVYSLALIEDFGHHR